MRSRVCPVPSSTVPVGNGKWQNETKNNSTLNDDDRCNWATLSAVVVMSATMINIRKEIRENRDGLVKLVRILRIKGNRNEYTYCWNKRINTGRHFRSIQPCGEKQCGALVLVRELVSIFPECVKWRIHNVMVNSHFAFWRSAPATSTVKKDKDWFWEILQCLEVVWWCGVVELRNAHASKIQSTKAQSLQARTLDSGLHDIIITSHVWRWCVIICHADTRW
jgi:hypothetical protein